MEIFYALSCYRLRKKSLDEWSGFESEDENAGKREDERRNND